MQPIFLVHGFLGYRRLLLWEMFPGVVEQLKQKGFAAYRVLIHPTASIEERTQQLHEAIRREAGEEEKIHLIGHSMGGLDARYFVSPGGLAQGSRVISVTTISSPHRGSPVADRIPASLKALFSFGAGIGKHLPMAPDARSLLRGVSENRWDALKQLTPAYLNETFNPQTPDDPRVRYFSYGGKISPPKNLWSNFPRPLTWRIVQEQEGDNDGLVSVESAKWGEFLGAIPADHGEQIGLKINPWKHNAFDHLTFFSQIADNLAQCENKKNR
ncbi:MAG: alpha/beta fold hydrolase [Candidatus Omnitrophota bacterium]